MGQWKVEDTFSQKEKRTTATTAIRTRNNLLPMSCLGAQLMVGQSTNDISCLHISLYMRL
jgi:hypothetical protein